ncbi:MAG: FGGY-family carbohydrate kinase [Eubacteriales bacterium]|nr:FGGY-family carbohydrate kinase [Eubacteriales bacterium]
MKILVLEASTTSAKAMLYDTVKNESEIFTREYGNIDYRSIHAGDQIFKKMLSAGRQLTEGKDIDIISIGTTWHSLMLCDKHMDPVTPLYLWNNMAAADVCTDIRKEKAYTDSFYKSTGCMVHAMYPVFKLEYLKRQGIPAEQYFLVNLGTYLTWKMSGIRISTRCMASGSGFLNLYTGQYDHDIMYQYGVKDWQMSPLAAAEMTVPLQQSAASCLGLTEGIPVVPAEPDGGLNQIGVGAVKTGIATLSIGTSGAIRVSAEKPAVSDRKATWCYRSPAGYLAGAATNGCNCIDWMKRNIFPGEVSYAQLETGITEKDRTPVFLPFLFGERCPGWKDDRKAGFVNLLPEHTVYDLYGSIQEGILFNLFQCYGELKKSGITVKKIMLSGGILHSQRWTKMCADIFQREMCINQVEQGSLLGGAALGMKILGVLDSLESFEPQITEVVVPEEERGELYKKKYQRYLDSYNCFGEKE